MDNREVSNNNFMWPLGRLPANPEGGGALPDDIRTAVEQLLPSGQGSQGAHFPAAAAAQPATAHVINMGAGGAAGGQQAPGQAGDEQARAAQPQLPSVKQLFKTMQGAIPFIVMLLTKILYDHRLGILVFVGLFGTFYHVNSSLKRQIAQREGGSLMEWYGAIAWIITFLSANIAIIYYIFDEQELWRSLYLAIPNVSHLDVWNLFWIVVINDFILKFGTVIVKALVTLTPKQILPYKKKGKYYMLVEYFSQFYRSVVPITPWIYFLQDDQHGGPWVSAILVIFYTICKGGHIYSKCKELQRAFTKFQVDVSYGLPASQAQMNEADNTCPICQDKLSDPVMLSCKHVFCEDCVSLWFDRERTCPMCRANIVDNPQWRDGNTNANPQIY